MNSSRGPQKDARSGNSRFTKDTYCHGRNVLCICSKSLRKTTLVFRYREDKAIFHCRVRRDPRYVYLRFMQIHYYSVGAVCKS